MPLSPTILTHRDHLEPAPAEPVRARRAVPGADPTPSARFSWTVPTDSWWWSPGCYTLHGYRPGEVVPTTARFLSHRHREDLYDYVDTLHRAAMRAGVVVFEHTMVDVRGVAGPVVLLARSLADADGEIRTVNGELLPVGPLHAYDLDDWRLSVISAGLDISRAGAAAVLDWRCRNDPSWSPDCLIRIAKTLLLTHRELTVRAQFEEDFLAPWMFAGPATARSS
jgi:hypothetical protein